MLSVLMVLLYSVFSSCPDYPVSNEAESTIKYYLSIPFIIKFLFGTRNLVKLFLGRLTHD